jgi:hypothetical protein
MRVPPRCGPPCGAGRLGRTPRPDAGNPVWGDRERVLEAGREAGRNVVVRAAAWGIGLRWRSWFLTP